MELIRKTNWKKGIEEMPKEWKGKRKRKEDRRKR
jgi:hypothetical protein